MSKRSGWLKRIDDATNGDWIASMGGPRPMDSLAEVLDPGLKQVSQFTDDELAEVIAREPSSKLGLLAGRVQRERESWRTPARWALVVSVFSFGLALTALVRTL